MMNLKKNLICAAAALSMCVNMAPAAFAAAPAANPAMPAFYLGEDELPLIDENGNIVDLNAPAIDLNVKQAHLVIGQTTKIQAKVVNSNERIKWTSSDPAVATVDKNGVVTAIRPGETMVTASISDCSLSVDIVVYKAAVPEMEVNVAKPNLKAGETTTAAVSHLNGKKVAWSSADPAVATVNQNGVITAVAGGKTLIYAEVPGFLPVGAPVMVTGEAPKPDVKPVETTISLSASALKLTEGEASVLTAKVNPADKAVVWTSSNSAVATVANGKVVAVSAGSAVITATADGKSASCAVTVAAKEIPVEPPVVEGTWNPATIYNGGEQVTYNGVTFVAQWWTQNEKPDAANPWGVWKVVSGGNEGGTEPSEPSVPADGSWVAGQVYHGGDQVTYNGRTFVAQWWTQNEKPDAANAWGAWKVVG